MIIAYFIFYAVLALIFFGMTEYSEKVKIFAQKYLPEEEKKLPEIHSHYHEILSKYFKYYLPLNHESKIKFISRVGEFINDKKFIGMDGLKVTEEMKVLISASAVQLTFGLEKYLMEFFKIIRIYPKYFYSKLLHAELKGGASESGVLMLSWEDFLLGYKNSNDNYNLGLHEMAHVLKINVLRGSEFDEKFSFYLDDWLNIGDEEFKQLKSRHKSLLRESGGTNKHEFFAVCAEHFFENPQSFKEYLPDIYNHLCFLLNQDPQNSEENYNLKKNFAETVNKNKERVPIPKHIKMHYKYHGWHWTYSLMLAGIFAGILFTILFSTFTIIAVWHIILYSLAGGLLSFIIQYPYLVIKNQVFKPADFFLYVVFGVMPLVSFLFLTTNYLVRLSYTEEVYVIDSHVRRSGETVFTLQGHAYQDYPSVRSLRKPDDFYQPGEKLLKIKFSEGVFGYKCHAGSEVVAR